MLEDTCEGDLATATVEPLAQWLDFQGGSR
jgi:hypothetical protein